MFLSILSYYWQKSINFFLCADRRTPTSHTLTFLHPQFYKYWQLYTYIYFVYFRVVLVLVILILDIYNFTQDHGESRYNFLCFFSPKENKAYSNASHSFLACLFVWMNSVNFRHFRISIILFLELENKILLWERMKNHNSYPLSIFF